MVSVSDFKNQEIKVLDHGFVRLVDVMGDDASVVQAARVSYGSGTKTVREDRGLINYLISHGHTSPFEMCEIKLHVKLPIFIARQWIRHRTANVNEYSARYSVVNDEFYVPSADTIAVQSKNNKQGRGDVFDSAKAEEVRSIIEGDSRHLYENYEQMLDDENYGVAREIARINLSLNYYTEWYWKIDLHNLLHFLKVRMHSHAQYEIREYANAMAEIVKEWVPYTWEAFEEHVLHSEKFSRTSVAAIKSLLEGKSLDDLGLSKRELANLKRIFDL